MKYFLLIYKFLVKFFFYFKIKKLKYFFIKLLIAHTHQRPTMSKQVNFKDDMIAQIKAQEELIQKQRAEIKLLEESLANLRRLTGISEEVQQCAITGFKYINKLKTHATYEIIAVEDECGRIKRQTNCDCEEM